MLDINECKVTFASLNMSAANLQLVEEVKQKAAELLQAMSQVHCEPKGEHMRCFATAKTKLEEAVMWHVKGVSRIDLYNMKSEGV